MTVARFVAHNLYFQGFISFVGLRPDAFQALSSTAAVEWQKLTDHILIAQSLASLYCTAVACTFPRSKIGPYPQLLATKSPIKIALREQSM